MSSQVTIEFSIPAATLQTTPLSQTFDLGVGSRLLESIEVVIPDGHKGLATLSIEAPGRAIVPAPGSNVPFIRGNNEKKLYESLNLRLDGPPYYITCRGYNLDKFFPHTFLITCKGSG